MVCDIVKLDGFVEHQVLEPFGYSNLNRLEPFRERVPTTENLCIEIYTRLERGFRAAQVEKVRLEETMLNAFEYAGEKGLARRGGR
jgi:6-pyruvoyltetrahydropterin/6-carboxytetrahydropterin synthase